MTKKVLITGMSGLIGGLLKTHLTAKGGYELTALNRSSVEGVRTFQSDITDIESISPAFDNQDVVVHLAAYIGSQEWEHQHSVNVVGTYNVFEAARKAGVKRVIFASSGSAIRGFERVSPYKEIAEGTYHKVPKDFEMITHEQVRPDALYGATKVWGEALGLHFSAEYNLSVISVPIRVGKKENKPLSMRENASYLGHEDICNMLRLCIDAPDTIRCETVFAVSNNKWNYRDLTHAKEILGYKPVNSADDNFFNPAG